MRYFRKLDRYVAASFTSSYLICFLFFLGIFIVIDLVPKVDDIMDAAPLAAERGESLLFLTIRFYLMKTPEIFLMVAPFLTVMAAMFSVTRLRKSNELIPMVMAGISIHRILLPTFVMAGALLLGMVLVQEYVAPACAEKRMVEAAFLFEQEPALLLDQEVFWDMDGKEIVVRKYNVATQVIGSADISYLKQHAGREVHCSIEGKNLRWLGPEDRAWSMEEGYSMTEDFSDIDTKWQRQALKKVEIGLTPADIVVRIKEMTDLTFGEIRRAYVLNPQDLRMKILLHYRITFPLSNLLLLLLGIPFVLRHENKSTFLGLTIALFLCGAYFVLDVIMRDLGTKNQLNPVLAAWFATIFCGAAGIYFFDNIRT